MPELANGRRPILEIRDLRVEAVSSGKRSTIVDGLDLSLNSGEVLGLIGESGAGKSTMGLAALGYFRPGTRAVAGSVRFGGTDLLNAPQATLLEVRGKKIVYVAQSAAAAFNPAHRIIDQVVEPVLRSGSRSRAEATADAVELFTRMQLPDPERFGRRYPHQVSGGQLQRAMIAMAMSCRPDIIVFDEPTTALDVTTQLEILASIRDLVRHFGTAAIYITHDLAVIAQIADRIMVLRHGRLVEEAPTRRMLAAPAEEYTRSLWSVRNLRVEKPRDDVQADVLAVQNISASYGALQVLHDVSLAFERGKTSVIVGESGSGKSTLARCITGLLKPTAGSVALHQQVLPAQLARRSRSQLRKIQMVFQMPDTALNPRKRIAQIIGRPVRIFRGLRGAQNRERVAELLRQIGLEPADYLDRFPGELSGGQKQRLCIARALAAEPEVLICDEVTSALDQLVAKEILNLLSEIQKSTGIAIIFITHDLSIAKAIADNIIVMSKGRVVENKIADDLFRPPYQEYTELLISSMPDMDPDWLSETLSKRRKAG